MSLFSQILQFLLTGITIGTIYGMVALGFNIIYNATGIINFAQGEFVMLGGMFMVWFTTVLKIPMIAAFALSVIMVTLIGALFERLAIYPLKRPSVLILIMITLAGSIIMKGSAMLFWGKETYTLPHFSGEEPFYLFGATILPQTLWILGIMFVVVIILAGFFNFTMLGKAMRACAVNPTAASLVGISVKKMVLLSFALSAALGATAGIIITPVALMEYDRGAILALKGFAAAVLGGLGNGVGAVVAGLLIGILESLGAGLISSGYKDAIALLVLLLVLFVKPSGIFGVSEASKLKEF
ncbi:MAG: branched-chain amino acid ABC transporter permease [Proteobacteria bacterium]|nr:branched-chain amino acid ABC transporter permease [Pseudomonadota bacterium]